ncbi:MAG: transposase [Pseudomonadota bacterium]
MRRVEATLIVAWLAQRASGLPGTTATALMVRRALTGWLGIARQVQGGSVEIGTNAAERAIRPVALDLGTWLFEGSDEGGGCSAGVLFPIEAASIPKPSSAMPSPASKFGQSSDQPRREGLAEGVHA